MNIESKKYLKLFLIIVLVITITNCDTSTQPGFEPKLVVNGQLNAGYTIDSIFVSMTEDISEVYGNSQVSAANVIINGQKLEEYRNAPGVYFLDDSTYIIKSGETYQLEVEAAGMKVKSTTIVPSPFQFFSQDIQGGDTVQFIPGDSWVSDAFFTLSWPNYIKPNVLIFRVLSLAEEALEKNRIEDDRTLTDILKGEDRYEQNPSIWWTSSDFPYARINWMYFNYRGWHIITVSAMDENYYLYRNGILFNDQRPGEQFNQVIEGGYGLFSSCSTDTIRVFVAE
jgi:hypothetical protein